MRKRVWIALFFGLLAVSIQFLYVGFEGANLYTKKGALERSKWVVELYLENKGYQNIDVQLVEPVRPPYRFQNTSSIWQHKWKVTGEVKLNIIADMVSDGTVVLGIYDENGVLIEGFEH